MRFLFLSSVIVLLVSIVSLGIFVALQENSVAQTSENVYFVAKTGSDANSCDSAQSEATPKLTIASAIACIGSAEGAGAGKTILVKAGIYNEGSDAHSATSLPGGTSWSAPFVLKAYPGDIVILRPNPGEARVFTIAKASSKYAIIDGFVMDAVNVQFDAVKITYMGSDPTTSAHHIRIENSEIMNAPEKGILITTEASGNELVNSKVHDNGKTDFHHGINFSSDGNLITGSEFYRNAGSGINKYPLGSNNIIRNNRLYDNARVGLRGAGIGLYGGSGNLVYNNLVWGNRIGIALQYGESNDKIYNNTIYGNINYGIYNGVDSTNESIKNNIVYQNGSGITNLGPRTAFSNNLSTDPGFANAAARVFYLLSGSPAIDAGEDLSAEGVATDFSGISRPQGFTYDIGAYEFVPSPSTPLPPSGLTGVTFSPILESGPSVGHSFTIQIYSPSGTTPLFSFTESMGSGGNLTLPATNTFSTGSYNIRVSSPQHLSRLFSGVTLAANTAVSLSTALKAGNLNNDNTIDSLDWSLMNPVWFTPDTGNTGRADVNRSGSVTSIDFSFLARNWGVVGDFVVPTPGGSAQHLTYAAVPDLQNYCSSQVNVASLPALGITHLRAMANDIITVRPAFVVQVGDVTDSTGGSDQNGVAADADDPDTFVTMPSRYSEVTCVKENFFDLLDAAGIPWIAVSGNHDSYRDFERGFPRATFMAKSYGFAAQNEVDRWHTGWNDTEERAALFSTPIGPICVVGGDYAMDPAGGTLDATFVSTNIGCGGSTPTILVRHYGIMDSVMGVRSAANAEIFMGVFGHITPQQPGIMQSMTMINPTSGQMANLFTNSQEVSLSCGVAATDGTSMHTGVSWWTVVAITPSASTVAVQARNPLFSGAATDPSCGNTYQNTVLTFSPNLCTRFPSMTGC